MARNPEHLDSDPTIRGRQQGRKLAGDSRRGQRGKAILGTAAATAVAAFGPGLAESAGEAVGKASMPEHTIGEELSDYGISGVDRSDIELPHPTEADTTVKINLPEDKN